MIQTDIDAVHVYNRAVEQVSDDVIHSQLTTFRDHHMKHISVLSDEIQLLERKRPGSVRISKGISLRR